MQWIKWWYVLVVVIVITVIIECFNYLIFFFVCGSSSYDLLERIYVWWSRNRGSMKWKAIVKMAMEWCFVKNSKIQMIIYGKWNECSVENDNMF